MVKIHWSKTRKVYFYCKDEDGLEDFYWLVESRRIRESIIAATSIRVSAIKPEIIGVIAIVSLREEIGRT